MRPCHPKTLAFNRAAALVALAGIAVVVAVMIAAVLGAAGLIPTSGYVVAIAFRAIPIAAALLVTGGIAYAATSSHAY